MQTPVSLITIATAFTLCLSSSYALDEKQSAVIARASKAISAEPNNAGLIHDRGVIYLAFGDISNAVKDLEKANKLQPNDPPTLDGLGAAYMRMKRWKAAISAFNSVLSKVEFYNSRFARGHARIMVGDIYGGRADIEKATSQFPGVHQKYGKYYGILPQ